MTLVKQTYAQDWDPGISTSHFDVVHGSAQDCPHLAPRPLGTPRAIPLPLPAAPPLVPLVLDPRAIPLPPARLLPVVPRPAAAPLEVAVEGGTELYLLLGLLLVGGFITNEVSVVRNVASVSGGAVRCGKDEFSRGFEEV